MIFSIIRFELNYYRKQPLVYVLSGIFFLLAFLATSTPNVSLIGGTANLNINSPYAIVTSLSVLGIFAMFGAIAFCSGAVLRDYEHKTAELFLSSGVSKFDYVFGRFFGALPLVFMLHIGALLGVMTGEFMPWNDVEKLGAFSLEPYWFSTWAMMFPTLFFLSSIFFCITTITRNMMATYVAAVGLLMLSFLLDSFTEKDTLAITNMLDPFGLSSWESLTRYWTVYEKNQLVPELAGDLLYNRVIWLALGTFFLAVSYRFFPFSIESVRNSKPSKKQPLIENSESRTDDSVSGCTSNPQQEFGWRMNVRQLLSQATIEVKNIIFSIPFIVVLFLGMLMVVAGSIGNLGDIFGTSVYPTTASIILIINGSFSLSLLIVLIYYSGELMSKERSVGLNEIIDAMPHPNWIMLLAKLSGAIVVIISMLLVAMLSGIGVQIYLDYYDFDLFQYFQGLFFFFQFPLYFMCILAVFFYLISRSKYMSMFLMVLYIIYVIAMPAMGYEHNLYRMYVPNPRHSDFTGYSYLLTPYLWYALYWALWGGLLLIASLLIWPRGSEDRLGTIFKVARQRLTPPMMYSLIFVAVGITGTGSYIFYNTNILNQYTTEKDQERNVAEYEKTYSQYQDQIQPVMQRVYTEVDIYPHARDVKVHGYYDIVNNSAETIGEIHFSIPPNINVVELSLKDSILIKDDAELNYRIYQFVHPLQPGEGARVKFKTEWLTPGFKNRTTSHKVTTNGTFFNNLDILPLIGYQKGVELVDNSKRRAYDLPPVERLKKIDDPQGLKKTVLGQEKRLDFETIVSTSSDQIAIAPGYLQNDWQKEGRSYFHYKMDAPIWNFFSYLSADYKVKKEVWQGVSIEVYYHHEFNVDRMIEASKKSLAYFNKNFSTYQYRQFRILEFPGYQGAFAQSFPNTIPFSERIGFVADLRDKTEIDYVFYVTAHELAHQWWAHQVLSADVQGSTMIVESLAQYSALMVMEAEYGKEKMQRFLKYELDRYLRSRGGELIEELPLFLVENQPYIHYRKGSVNLYALQDYIGSEKVNRALKEFIHDYAFKGAPFPTSLDLIAKFRSVAGDEYQSLITDLLEKIVIFDLKVDDYEVSIQEDGRYKVSIDVKAHKFEADGEGLETEVALNGLFDIAVLGEKQGEDEVPEVIYLKKHKITGNAETISLIVDKPPSSVGIDPFNKMIDRNPDDNVMKVDY